MERDQVPVKWKWNLDLLLKGKTTTALKAEISSLGNKLVQQETTFLRNYNTFYQFHRDEERLGILATRLAVYYYNFVSQDTRNNDRLSDLLEFEEFLSRINERLFWLANKLYDNEVTVRKFLVSELASYLPQYERFFLFKEHRVSDDVEKVLSILQPSCQGYGQIFSTLTSSDFKFKDVMDSKGQAHLLTNGTYNDLFTSQDDKLRENTYHEFWEKYYTFRNTLSTNYYNSVLANNKISQIYKYTSALSVEMAHNFLDKDFFLILLKTISKNAFLVTRIHKIICAELQNNNPKPWEFSKPLFAESTKKYSITEGIKIIYSATNILGAEYKAAITKLIENNSIDLMPNIGKRQGAYSYSAYRILPYICLNWTGRFNDVSTLIHELGHAVHSIFSDSEQNYQYHSYPIFLAEIASTVNELLLFKDLYHKSSQREEKLVLLEKAISLFKNTVFRQAMFADYELFAHEFVASGKAITADIIQQECLNIGERFYPKLPTQKYSNKYYGLWGLYVPHFYNHYYVYKYASSMICATVIVAKITEDPTFLQKYCWFLKQGCRWKPLELLKKIGIDLKNEKVYSQAMKYFATLISEFEKHLGERHS